jgi:peptidoglycan hydrolase-like protein with peptidoglycan-binding domain
MKLSLCALLCLLIPAILLANPTTPTTTAEMPPAPVLPKAPEPIESILRTQIFLDGKLFGPGKVDGRPGEFTTKALKRYQAANGLPQTELDAHTLDLSSITELYTTYIIREEDLKLVARIPHRAFPHLP